MPILRIKEKFWETGDACSFYFENVEGGTLYFKPGQFLTLILQIEGKEVRRSYSLCTVPVKDKYPGITIKRVASGVISNFLLDHLKEGDVVECDYPTGIFFPEVSTSKCDYFLIGAGSGITPLYSILQTLLHKDTYTHVTLIYANRDESSIIYKEKLEVLDFQHADRLKVVHVLSKPSPEWEGFKDRIQPGLLKSLIEELLQHNKRDARFFVCGPKGFMLMAQNAILELGYNSEQIRMEDFTTGVGIDGKKPSPTFEHKKSKHVKILYRQTAYELDVPEGMYILEAALEQGIQLPHSCQNGVCTACVATCLEGVVDTEEADGLSDGEKKRGYVLTCVAKPLSDHVTLEFE